MYLKGVHQLYSALVKAELHKHTQMSGVYYIQFDAWYIH